MAEIPEDPFETPLRLPAPDRGAAPRAPSHAGPVPPDRDAGFKDLLDFLYPPMPGKFSPYWVRKKPVEWLQDRYLNVLAASLGNHSIALFYCCWSRDQFEKVLEADPTFQARIDEVRERLADRATFIMHRGMGLISERTVGGAELSPTPPVVTAALAKVVEKMSEKAAGSAPKRARGRKLVIEGLDRTKSGPPPDEKRHA